MSFREAFLKKDPKEGREQVMKIQKSRVPQRKLHTERTRDWSLTGVLKEQQGDQPVWRNSRKGETVIRGIRK